MVMMVVVVMALIVWNITQIGYNICGIHITAVVVIHI